MMEQLQKEPTECTVTSIAFKVIELLLCLIALVFICLGAARFWSLGLVLAVLGVIGYIIGLIVITVLYILDNANLLMELGFLTCTGLLNLIGGILSLIVSGDRGYGEYPRGNSNWYRLIVAVLCIVNGLLIIIDSIFAYRRKN